MTGTDAKAWGAVLVSCLASIAFLAALTIAYVGKDQSNLTLLMGAVVSNFSTVVSFYLGSSVGSEKKDEAIATLAQK